MSNMGHEVEFEEPRQLRVHAGRRWGVYQGKNSATYANPGRKTALYQRRKLTIKQSLGLLNALPKDVRMVCMVALFCGLRISEVLGLCWKHVDMDRGMP
jgi:integrase